MILKTYIDGNALVLKDVLEYTELFDHITMDEETLVLSCYGADNKLLGKIYAGDASGVVSTIPLVRAYYNDESYQQSVTGGKCEYAYAYKGAVIMHYVQSGNHFAVCIAKDMNDGVVFIFSSSKTSLSNCLRSPYCVCYGDGAPISQISFSQITAKQNGLLVFPTNSLDNHTSNAFFVVYGNLYTETEREFTLNGQKFFTNGAWCIRDDEVEA